MGDADKLLSDLNDRQREAVTTLVAPLAILAGAGSGKTRVLARRIAWQAAEGISDPRHALAVTFTRKAAGELSDRLGTLGVRRGATSGTFHGLALGQLRRRWRDRSEAVPALLERKSKILAPLLGGGPAVGAEAAEVAGEIEWAKARLIVPDGYEAAVVAAGRATPRPAGEIASLYGRYETEKARRGVVDFDDLLWRLADALEGDPEFAAVIRWRFRHLFVDEFQDVNPAQFRLIRLWLGDRRDLCVVGDDDQAVYGFTGADAGYLVHFARHFSGAGVGRRRPPPGCRWGPTWRGSWSGPRRRPPAARPPGATGGSTSTSWSGWATTTWRPTRLSRRGAPSYRPAPQPAGSSPGSSPSWPTTIPPPPTPWSS